MKERGSSEKKKVPRPPRRRAPYAAGVKGGKWKTDRGWHRWKSRRLCRRGRCPQRPASTAAPPKRADEDIGPYPFCPFGTFPPDRGNRPLRVCCCREWQGDSSDDHGDGSCDHILVRIICKLCLDFFIYRSIHNRNLLEICFFHRDCRNVLVFSALRKIYKP